MDAKLIRNIKEMAAWLVAISFALFLIVVSISAYKSIKHESEMNKLQKEKLKLEIIKLNEEAKEV